MTSSAKIKNKRQTKSITIVIPTFNEQENVRPIYDTTKALLESTGLEWNILFIDNASTDLTRALLSEIAEKDGRVLLIFNRRNFGTIRSPLHGFFEAPGDAVIIMSADFQDPPELISEFVEHWSRGLPLVLGVKRANEDIILMRLARWGYYSLLGKLSSVTTIRNFYGFGLYDREFIETVRQIGKAPLLLRSMPGELGYTPKLIPFDQPARKHGKSKNKIWDLVLFTIFSVVDRAEVFDKIFVVVGMATIVVSLLVATIYLMLKITFWYAIPTGVAPMIILMSFFFGVNFFLLGLIYGHNKIMFENTRNLPLVTELARYNFNREKRDAGN